MQFARGSLKNEHAPFVWFTILCTHICPAPQKQTVLPAQPRKTPGVAIGQDNRETTIGRQQTTDGNGQLFMGQTVGVEYVKDTDEAVHVYLVGGDKGVGVGVGAEPEDTGGGMGGAVPIAIIIVLLAIAAAVVTVVVRNRRKPESK